MATRGNRPASPAGRSRYGDGAKPLHSDRELFKWDRAGKEVVGEFISVRPFKDSSIGKVRTADGVVAFSCPSMLESILEEVKPGTGIGIVYTGDKPSAKGSPMKLFEVWELPASV